MAARDNPTPEGQTDVSYWYDNAGGDPLGYSTFGRYRCLIEVAASNPRRCQHAHITFNDSIGSPPLSYTAAERWHLACHETGHSFGLVHPEDAGLGDDPDPGGCMIQVPLSDYDALGPHNAHHVRTGRYDGAPT